MRALTQRMLDQAGYSVNENPTIAALADFAAQRSGINARDYFDTWRDHEGRKAYNTEIRDISKDLARFRDALNVAAVEDVTDADVIAAAPEAYRGRLIWTEITRYCHCPSKTHPSTSRATFKAHYFNRACEKCGVIFEAQEIDQDRREWQYTTGQYFPTEYRKAAATVLEYATRSVRRARPAETAERITTIDQLKALNERNGGCWFSSSTMRFHGTTIQSGIIRGEYFITLDKLGFDESAGYGYTIRRFNNSGDVFTFAKLAEFGEKRDALRRLREHFAEQEAAQ